MATVNRACEYKGKRYLCVWMGQTQYGRRAKLRFFSGGNEFWADASLVSFAAPVAPPSPPIQVNEPAPVPPPADPEPIPPAPPVASEPVKTALCVCLWSEKSETLTVTSPSGRKLAVAYSALWLADRALCDRLCGPLFDEIEQPVELTYPEMRVLATAANGQGAPAPAPTSPPAPIQVNEPAPVVSAPIPPAPPSPPVPPAPVAPAPTVDEATGRVTLAMMMRNAGMEAKGQDWDSVRFDALSKAAQWCKDEDLHTLQYDIPDLADIANPSKVLWSLGAVRDSLSCWVMREKTWNSPDVQGLIALWTENGVRIRHRRVHPDDLEETAREIANALRTFLIERHTALIRGIDCADQRLSRALEAMGNGEGDKTESQLIGRRDSEIRADIKGAAEDIKRAVACAEAFDLHEEVADLLEGIRAAARAAQRLFNAEMQARNGKLSEVKIPQ